MTKTPAEIPAVAPVPDSEVKKLDLHEVFIVVQNYRRVLASDVFEWLSNRRVIPQRGDCLPNRGSNIFRLLLESRCAARFM